MNVLAKQFDIPRNRRNTNSYKWDSRNDVPADTIPLWVADMDFRVAEPIIEALQRKVESGIFGYTFVGKNYYEALINWFENRHNWRFQAKNVIYTSGVVPAISAIIKALTKPGDKVLMLTPVYNCFFSSIRNNGCIALESPLSYSEQGCLKYEINWSDFENKAADPKCRIMLLCNPHNPVGRVWHADELKRISEICRRNNVIVVSDEIHCELVYNPIVYTPFATVSCDKRWITCVSPTKAFNIAGLQIANIIASTDELRAKIDRAINDNEVCDVNPFGVTALITAYNECYPWLEAVIEYIHENYRLLVNRFESELPELHIADLEGTYLAWVDCNRIGMSSDALEEYLIKEAHVWLNAGAMYGSAGEGFMRINLACARSVLSEALDRLVPVLRNLLNENK